MEFLALMERLASLKSLVSGEYFRDEMARILEAIGDTSLQAARRALAEQGQSSKPSRELESAITCLRVAFEASAPRYDTLLERLFGPCPRPKENQKACEIACLVFVCYSQLGEKNLTAGWAALAWQHFEKYAEEYIEVEAELAIPSWTGVLDSLAGGPQRRREAARVEVQTKRGPMLSLIGPRPSPYSLGQTHAATIS